MKGRGGDHDAHRHHEDRHDPSLQPKGNGCAGAGLQTQGAWGTVRAGC